MCLRAEAILLHQCMTSLCSQHKCNAKLPRPLGEGRDSRAAGPGVQGHRGSSARTISSVEKGLRIVILYDATGP